MHWLPLVAMVIASALPFPHDPTSRIVAATTTSSTRAAGTATSDLSDPDQPTSSSLHRHEGYSSHQPFKDYKSAPVDNNMADKDLFLPSSNDDSGVNKLDLADTLNEPPTEELTDAKTHASLDFNTNLVTKDTDLPSRRTEGGFLSLDNVLEDGDMFLDAHPRVLFSTSPPQTPPELLMLEEDDQDWDSVTEGHGDSADGHRVRRERRAFDGRWVQMSVCESENHWVTNKTTAVDMKGNRVSIIQEIQTQIGRVKQYFYETRCRRTRPGGRHEEMGAEGASCLGIDKKQWKSKCIAKQSFVRALTKDTNNRVGWRWIRIDSSCVCVLMSRTNSRPQGREGPVMAGRGRG